MICSSIGLVSRQGAKDQDAKEEVLFERRDAGAAEADVSAACLCGLRVSAFQNSFSILSSLRLGFLATWRDLTNRASVTSRRFFAGLIT